MAPKSCHKLLYSLEIHNGKDVIKVLPYWDADPEHPMLLMFCNFVIFGIDTKMSVIPIYNNHEGI